MKAMEVNSLEFYPSYLIFWLKFMGIDVLNAKEGIFCKIRLVCYMLLAVIYTAIVSREFLFHKDFNMISVIIIYVTYYSLTIVKVVVIYRNRKEVGDLMMSFHREPFKPNKARGGEFEEQCVGKILKKSRSHMICYGLTIMMSFISGLTASLKLRLTQSPENWILPFAPLSIADITHSPNFELLYICQILAAFLFCSWLYLTNYTVILIIAHTTAQINVLEHTVRHYKSINKHRLIANALAYTINYHLNILQIVDKVEYLCSYMVLCVFLSALVMVCAAMYNASAVSLGSIEFARYLFFFTMMAGEPFIYCWWGNEMTLANETLAVGIAQTYDPNDSIRSAKALKLMLIKSQKPLFFTAGKFVPLSVETFKGLLKASFSYFTVLRQVNSQ